jgi:hypothetical protein
MAMVAITTEQPLNIAWMALFKPSLTGASSSVSTNGPRERAVRVRATACGHIPPVRLSWNDPPVASLRYPELS